MLERKATIPQALGAYLVKDSWNDFGFFTTFNLLVRLQDGPVVRVGFLRIGHVDMTRSEWNRTSDRLPDRFESLDDGYFSLGMEDDYYEALRANLSRSMAYEILYALKDAAFAQQPDQATLDLQVFSSSLLRGRTTSDLLRTRQVALGIRARIVPFKWSYTPEQRGLLPAPELTFESRPGSLPPTNMHALIGPNAVGKSSLLHAIASAAENVQLDVEDDPDPAGDAGRFASCVVIGFSPFDRHSYAFAPVAGIPFHFIRLRHQDEDRLKTDDELKEEFIHSFASARIGARGLRWRKAIETLSHGASGFLDGDKDVIEAMIREGRSSTFEREMGKIFENLSSGHKVVLLMVTRLIEVVSERTLVLIDEPETHLHPPLTAALTNALSDLLADRNGMAVIATHSPVVLQEVPASCVHVLKRNGDELTARRPDLETYGESVGELTYDVFGLEVNSTGFHAAISAAVEDGGTYAEIIRRFTGLGAEARALLRAMTFSQERGER
ncbi:AAA family ATPase [Streptomyces sp. NPDC090056]|uniref:AAA family ATPase n=1 Tax=Streptomyces sp. NPDC090056 TaxID=3365934 RepID=UPI003802E904